MAATRPRYGGTLQVAMRASLTSIDPIDSSQTDGFARANLAHLLFDSLVSLDDHGIVQPALATSWHADPGNQRWQFRLRGGVTFSDGSPVTAEVVAGSLRGSNPHWKIFPENEAIVVESDSSDPNLAAELAMPRNSIVKRQGSQMSGTGPFVVSDWDPGKKLIVAARNDYWNGRPFVDSIEIELGQSLREQAISLDLRRAHIIEAAPVGHPTSTENYRIGISAPVELVALVFNADRPSPEDSRLREVLALSIDRNALNNVVLQGGGESSAALLPNWMTGYGFIFPTDLDLARARQEFAEAHPKKSWTLSYDVVDPIARVVAERIALNVRDAGFLLQLTTSTADVRLARLPIVSLDPHVAMICLAEMLRLPQPKFSSDSIDDLYATESSLLQSRQVIPLLHLRTAFEVRPSVHDWAQTHDGSWRLQDVWLGSEKIDTEKP